MRWFKHMTDMLDDVFVSHLVDKYGAAGYGFWCGLLETYGKYAKDNCGDFVQIPWTALTHRLRTSSAKLQQFLSECEENAKLCQNKNASCLEIKIPKMVEMRDEWRSRKQKDSGVTREKLSSKKKETETELRNNTPVVPSLQEGEPPKKVKTFLPEDWDPDVKLLAWAQANHPTVDIEYQTTRFKNHFIGSGVKKLDWGRTWQNWIMDKQGYNRRAPAPAPKPLSKADKLLSFPVIKNRHDGYTIPTSELTKRPDMPEALYWQGRILPLEEFEGVV